MQIAFGGASEERRELGAGFCGVAGMAGEAGGELENGGLAGVCGERRGGEKELASSCGIRRRQEARVEVEIAGAECRDFQQREILHAAAGEHFLRIPAREGKHIGRFVRHDQMKTLSRTLDPDSHRATFAGEERRLGRTEAESNESGCCGDLLAGNIERNCGRAGRHVGRREDFKAFGRGGENERDFDVDLHAIFVGVAAKAGRANGEGVAQRNNGSNLKRGE